MTIPIKAVKIDGFRAVCPQCGKIMLSLHEVQLMNSVKQHAKVHKDNAKEINHIMNS